MTAHELKFFDTVAPEWDSRDHLSTPEKIHQLIRLAQIRPGDSVLDLGTGTGVLLPYMAQAVGKTGHITAVDLSANMLREAFAKFDHLNPKPSFIYTDFEKQELPGRYDHIILYCVYPHLETPVETLRNLRDRNLKPGGNIIIAFPCSADRINAIHHRNPVDADRLLPPSKLAAFLLDNNINTNVLADNDDLYIISITQE